MLLLRLVGWRDKFRAAAEESWARTSTVLGYRHEDLIDPHVGPNPDVSIVQPYDCIRTVLLQLGCGTHAGSHFFIYASASAASMRGANGEGNNGREENATHACWRLTRGSKRQVPLDKLASAVLF